MLARTRKSRAPDTGRMGEALKRPGIDPRTWVSLAVVQAVGVQDDGVYVDVMLIPSGLEEHARVSAAYSGSGYGLYLPVEVNDEVVVACPAGDMDNGLVVVGRMWSPADAPPPDAVTKPADLILLAREGATVRVATAGSGSIVLDPRGTGKVYLGGEDGTAPVARTGDATVIGGVVVDPTSDLAKLQAMLDTRYAIATPTNVLTPITGTITGGASKVEAK